MDDDAQRQALHIDQGVNVATLHLLPVDSLPQLRYFSLQLLNRLDELPGVRLIHRVKAVRSHMNH